MFIRSDLEEEIKNKFGIKKLVYQGTGENASNDCNLLLFETDKDILAIEFRLRRSYYYIYTVKELPRQPGRFFRIKTKISTLCAFGRQTYLKTNDVVTKFQGKAFDFTQELVVLALEEKK